MSAIDADAETVERRQSGVNPFEVVLWVMSIVFVVGGVLSVQWASRQQSLANGGYYCDADGNCTERYDVVLAQTIFMVAPAVVAAGLIAVVVAVALRALALNARRLAASTSPAASPSPQTALPGPDADVPTVPRGSGFAEAARGAGPAREDSARVDLPRRTARARVVDHSAFMRPRGD